MRILGRLSIGTGILLLIGALAGACTQQVYPPSDQITVEGTVTARGNEPFSELVLETPEHNWYVLELARTERAQFSTPGRFRVSGTLYKGNWNGQPFAFLRVVSVSRVQAP